MASHVLVLDATARRATVKTNPGTYLSDIRDEACKKLGVTPDQYTLKYNQKAIDLSRTVRLSSIPPGAKLDLVQQSRSPTVVSVALQLPASENNARLTKKLPSNTSLWQVLRIFESLPENPVNCNFTQRAAAEMGGSGSTGAGRLNYETPVLNLMGRERSSFAELQQTLGQLGISGSALIRLSFRNSGRPLEQAMGEISEYFKSDEEEQPKESKPVDTPPDQAGDVESLPDAYLADTTDPAPPSPMEDITPANETPQPIKSENAPRPTPIAGPGERPVVIFSPPSNATPQAASQPHISSEYDLSVDQARRYQNQLQELTRNKRLPSDAEIAEKEKAKSERLATIHEVKLRIRMPDQSQIEVKFTKDDSTKELFVLVRTMLVHGNQPFLLRYPSPKGGLVALKEGSERLVGGLGFQGRVLITCTWDDSVPMDMRRPPSLKEEWREKAQVLKVEEIQPSATHGTTSAADPMGKGKGRADPVDKESKLKALLNKGLFKKK